MPLGGVGNSYPTGVRIQIPFPPTEAWGLALQACTHLKFRFSSTATRGMYVYPYRSKMSHIHSWSGIHLMTAFSNQLASDWQISPKQIQFCFSSKL